MLLTRLYSNVMYKSEDNVRSSVHHTIKSYDKMQAGLHTFQTEQYEHDGVLLKPCSCLPRGCLMHRYSQKPLVSNLQLVKHLTSYSDPERESSTSGPVHDSSPHWLSYPFVTVVHLNLLMRLECIFLYSLAISQFYLLLLVSNVTSWNSAEINITSVVRLSLSTLHVTGTWLLSIIRIFRQWKRFPSLKKAHIPPSQWRPPSKYPTSLLNISFNTPLSRKTPWDFPNYYNLQPLSEVFNQHIFENNNSLTPQVYVCYWKITFF